MAGDEHTEPENEAVESPEDPSKRRFMSSATHALGACITCAVAVPSLAVVVHPVWSSPDTPDDAKGFVPVASVDRFTADGPFVRVVVKRDKSDAWLRHRGVPVGSILVHRDAKGAFTVFSAKCPHLGCAVNPAADGDGFFCPCHNSSFAPNGAKRERVDGATNPSPRGLDGLEHRVVDGTLWVKYVNFKTGTAEQIPVG